MNLEAQQRAHLVASATRSYTHSAILSALGAALLGGAQGVERFVGRLSDGAFWSVTVGGLLLVSVAIWFAYDAYQFEQAVRKCAAARSAASPVPTP